MSARTVDALERAATDGPGVLFVDDEPHNLELFLLQFGAHFPVLTAKSGEEALALLEREDIAVLLTDERMPGISGIELLVRVLARWPDVVRIIVSAYSDAPRLRAAINRGQANEYVVKPWDRAELRGCIERGLAMADRRRKLAARAERAEMLERDIAAAYGTAGIVTQDPGMQAMLAKARKVAQNDTTVLILGETGTGKELVARLIHEASPRAQGPFIDLNCAAVHEETMEDELFGHESGAFTGANKARRGRFELAEDGTIFLDEIGDISPKMQVSLLRVLQEKKINRIGGSAAVRVNARVITATHRNLRRLVREERFREDLYYRLNVVELLVPPLRERHNDIPLLVRHFIAKHTPHASPPPAVSEEVLTHLARYNWPGNIRELENMVQRTVVLCDGPALSLDDFCFKLSVDAEEERAEGAADLSPRDAARNAEREELRRRLDANGWNITKTAKQLGIARTTLTSRLKKHGLLP